MTIGLSSIKEYIFPIEAIAKAYSLMRYAGTKGVEGITLFAGIVKDDSFYIKEAIIPDQTGYRMEQGLLYSVSGEELYRINKDLYASKMMLGAQIHSHPGRAYHSDTDDAFPIVTVVGGLSIVVPNFAQDSIDVENWAVYRLSTFNLWEELTLKEVYATIKIIES